MSLNPVFCPSNHKLIESAFAGKHEIRKCDHCSTIVPAENAMSCVQCSYDLCLKCIQNNESPLISGHESIPAKLNSIGHKRQMHHSQLAYKNLEPLRQCKNGHELKKGRSSNNEVTCDTCQTVIQPQSSTYCDLCNYDVCPSCLK